MSKEGEMDETVNPCPRSHNIDIILEIANEYQFVCFSLQVTLSKFLMNKVRVLIKIDP